MPKKKSAPKKGSKPKKPLTPKQQEQKKNERNFKAFAKRRPNKSANEIMKEWRGKGKAIGNVKAKELVRDVRGARKQEKKATRVKTVTADQVQKMYLSKYSYVVTFSATRDEGESWEREALTLSYPTKQKPRDVIYEAKARIRLDNDSRYKYQPDWDSFRIDRLIVNENPMTAQEAREYKKKRRRK